MSFKKDTFSTYLKEDERKDSSELDSNSGNGCGFDGNDSDDDKGQNSGFDWRGILNTATNVAYYGMVIALLVFLGLKINQNKELIERITQLEALSTYYLENYDSMSEDYMIVKNANIKLQTQVKEAEAEIGYYDSIDPGAVVITTDAETGEEKRTTFRMISDLAKLERLNSWAVGAGANDDSGAGPMEEPLAPKPSANSVGEAQYPPKADAMIHEHLLEHSADTAPEAGKNNTAMDYWVPD